MTTSNQKQLAAGKDMDARRKLLDAKRELLKTLSNGSASPSDVDSGVEIVDVDPRVIAKQNSARSELFTPLSGGKPKDGFPAHALVSATDSASVTPDEARASLIKTMSAGRAATTPPPIEESTMHYLTPDGHQIASTVTPGSIMKLNQARRDLRGTMTNLEDTTKIAMAKDQLVKKMQYGRDNSRGATDTTLDSPSTPFGVPFSGGFPITCRGRSLEQLIAEERANTPTSVPAVSSGEDDSEGGDWSTSQAQGENFSASEDKSPTFRPG